MRWLWSVGILGCYGNSLHNHKGVITMRGSIMVPLTLSVVLIGAGFVAAAEAPAAGNAPSTTTTSVTSTKAKTTKTAKSKTRKPKKTSAAAPSGAATSKP